MSSQDYSGRTQGQNYRYNNTKILFIYLFSFSHKDVVDFSSGHMVYPRLTEKDIKIVLPIPITYLCESGFSS